MKKHEKHKQKYAKNMEQHEKTMLKQTLQPCYNPNHHQNARKVMQSTGTAQQ